MKAKQANFYLFFNRILLISLVLLFHGFYRDRIVKICCSLLQYVIFIYRVYILQKWPLKVIDLKVLCVLLLKFYELIGKKLLKLL